MEIMTAAERIELVHLRSIGVAEQDSTKCLGHNVRLIRGLYFVIVSILIEFPLVIHRSMPYLSRYYLGVDPAQVVHMCT